MTTIAVDPSSVIGPIKPMHAVNNGPVVPPVLGDQPSGNFEAYRAARIPYARTHDSVHCVAGGARTCDISAVFPDFDADENDPRNYDFVFTDHYLDGIRRAGTQVFFRLGQSIEHGPKKYGVLPPKDYAKWARICEHVIRHYNEGWGFRETESILNEWNYVKGWTDQWVYTLEVESGRFNQKGAAFVVSTMIDCQSKPLDMLMFYDSKVGTAMNGLFDPVTLWPLKGYYPFYAWSKLAALGTQVACEVRETGAAPAVGGGPATGVALDKASSAAPASGVRAVAARGPDGAGALVLARYAEDNNSTTTRRIAIRVDGADLSRARCHITDAIRTYTEVPLTLDADGTASLRLQPNSFALIEWVP